MSAFDGPSHWAEGQIARARGDKQKALAAFAAAREKMEAQRGDKPKDDRVLADRVARLMLGLAEKKRRSARHAARSSSCRSPRTLSMGSTQVANLALVYAWTGERDRALEQLEIVATIPETRRRHTAISTSIRAGIICAVIRASTRSLPQPRLPADSRHEFESTAAVSPQSLHFVSAGKRV